MNMTTKMNLPEFPVHVMKGGDSYWFTPAEWFEWFTKDEENGEIHTQRHGNSE